MNTDPKPSSPEKLDKIEEQVTFTPKEIEAIAEVVFGQKKSTVDKFTLWAEGNLSKLILNRGSHRKELEGYQKILLAPGNAAESLIRFGISLFNKETYKNLAQMADMVADTKTREMLQAALAKGWENCTPEEKTAFLAEVIFSSLMAYGGASKLAKIIPAAKLATITRAAGSTANVAAKSLLVKTVEGASSTMKWVAASPLDDVAVIGGATASKTIH